MCQGNNVKYIIHPLEKQSSFDSIVNLSTYRQNRKTSSLNQLKLKTNHVAITIIILLTYLTYFFGIKEQIIYKPLPAEKNIIIHG